MKSKTGCDVCIIRFPAVFISRSFVYFKKMKIPADKRIYLISFLLMFLLLLPGFLYGDGWCNIFFSQPGNSDKMYPECKSPEEGLIRAVRKSERCFYGAFYEIGSEAVIRELIDAKKRGVRVRLVIERDNIRKPGMQALVKAGIDIVTDDKRSLMHHKFAIIDERVLWTGSYNPTYNGGYKNNNNAVMVCSQELSKIYLDEFNEMFRDRIFGNRKEYTAFPWLNRKNHVEINDSDIYVYFSPEDDVENVIIKKIKDAKVSVYFMAFLITSKGISSALINAHRSGIKVRGVLERMGAMSVYSEYVKLKVEGIPVRLDTNKYRMHHKVFIFDEEKILTGSYNFSMNANVRNDENVIIFHDKKIAGTFLKEFFKIFK